jgi:hypothetical protein
MEMKDRLITCIQCENPFVFTAAEQARFSASGFDQPKRCPECRKKKDKGIQINPGGKGTGRSKHSRRKDDYDLYERS